MPISIKEFAKPKPTPLVLELRRFLDSKPADQVFTTQEIADALPCGTAFLVRAKRQLDGYFYLGSSRGGAFWGNPRAIRNLKKTIRSAR